MANENKRVIGPDMQEKTMTMGKQPIRTAPKNERLRVLAENLRNRIATREQTYAKARGEMGYNPSGTQGAKDTEAKWMPTPKKTSRLDVR
jgi:hypothetical protein